MPGIRAEIEVKGLDRQLAKLAQADPQIRKELRAGLGRSIKLIKSEVVPKVPRWSGRTVRGFRSTIKVERDGNFLVGKFYNRSSFWLRLVQEGRKPGKAPWYLPERFVAWVASVSGETGSKLKEAVFRVLHAIQSSGTKQAQGDIMGEALKATEPEVQRTFAAAVERVVKMLEVRE